MESEVRNSKCDEFKKCLMDRIGVCRIREELLRSLYGKHFHIFKRNIKKELDRNEIMLKLLEYIKDEFIYVTDDISEDNHGE